MYNNNDFQFKALTTAYGNGHGYESLNRLYALCAQTAGTPIDKIVDDAQTSELKGALLLCLKCPKAPEIHRFRQK